jgi:two-component system, chemotaxis family, chemotaxis protein CheY
MSKAEAPAHQGDEYIVVAEDSAPNRTILVLLLRKLGFKIIECADGDVAWKAMTENSDGKNIVAVISDLMMPNMDGLELLRRTRNDEKLKDLPFVLVTAVSDKDYIFEAKNLKVNGYILKPVTYKRVSAKLQELFPQKSFPQLAS